MTQIYKFLNFFITLIYEIYLMISRNTSNEENQLRQPYMRQISTSIRIGLVCIILLSQYQTSWSLRACVMNTRHQRKKTIREIMSESRKTCDKYQHVIIIFSIFWIIQIFIFLTDIKYIRQNCTISISCLENYLRIKSSV